MPLRDIAAKRAHETRERTERRAGKVWEVLKGQTGMQAHLKKTAQMEQEERLGTRESSQGTRETRDESWIVGLCIHAALHGGSADPAAYAHEESGRRGGGGRVGSGADWH